MSRSNKEEYEQNPATMEIEWAGGGQDGFLKFYDKELKETIRVTGEFSFAVLDELSAVRGWSDSHQSSILSNEVKRIGSEELSVFCFKNSKPHNLIEGIYKNIKGDVIEMGGKYHKIIYALVQDSKDDAVKSGSIVKILLKGAAMTGWIDLGDNKAGLITVSGYSDAQKGAVKYRIPTFTTSGISEDQDAASMEADKKLQGYFERKDAAASSDSPPIDTPPLADDTEEDVLDFYS